MKKTYIIPRTGVIQMTTAMVFAKSGGPTSTGQSNPGMNAPVFGSFYDDGDEGDEEEF